MTANELLAVPSERISKGDLIEVLWEAYLAYHDDTVANYREQLREAMIATSELLHHLQEVKS